MAVDPSYEYNAPQFVDFNLLKVGQDNEEEEKVEDYFNFDHENGHALDLRCDNENDLEFDPANGVADEPEGVEVAENLLSPVKAKSQASKENREDELPSVPQPKTSLVKPSAVPDVNKSIDKSKPLKASNNKAFMEGFKKVFSGSSKTAVAKSKPEERRSVGLQRSLSMRVSKTSSAPGRVAPQQNRAIQRRSAGPIRSRTKTTHESTHSRDSSGSRGNTSTSSVESVKSLPDFKRPGEMPAVKPKLTMPVTPSFMKRPAASSGIKSSEQLEMEKMAMLRKELAKKRHQAEESLKKSQQGPRLAPLKPAQPLTKPEEFHFASDLRLKNPTPAETNNTDRKDFVSSLRAHPSSPGKHTAHKGPTKPEPFHFSDGLGKKRKHEESDTQSQKFESMAETMAKFSSKTPDRFRTKPHNKEPTPVKKRFKSGDKPKLTMPKTPCLETRARTRSMHVPSHLELEEKELEEIKSYKFKAQPVNENIMKPHAVTGLKKYPAKEPTRFEEFDLEADRRIQTRAEARPKDQDKYEFRANPVPRSILEKPTGIKPVPERALTVPESPAFALKQRLRTHIKDLPLEPEETERVIKAKPVPHHGIPFQPKAPQQRYTAQQPFSFDSRDKQTLEKKEKKIQKVFEEEKKAREFRAKPIPDHSPVLPPKKLIPLTQPEPFELEAEIRGAMKAEEWSHKVEEELRHQRAMANFRAQPNKVVHLEPFVPKKANKQPTEPDPAFCLSTEQRAKERMDYEKWKKEKELESEADHIAAEKRRQAEEEAELRRLRVEAVPRAQPIRHFKPVEVKASDKPLTEPHTPRFSTRLRSKSVLC